MSDSRPSNPASPDPLDVSFFLLLMRGDVYDDYDFVLWETELM